MAGKVFFESLVIIRTAVFTADGIQFKADVFNIEPVENGFGGTNDFRICKIRACTVDFKTELVKFTLSAFLCTFIAIAGSNIIGFNGIAVIIDTVFENSP